jgi:Skp family chaperone for outer membrane proteins
VAKSIGKNILGLFVQVQEEEDKESTTESTSTPEKSVSLPSDSSTGTQDETVAKLLTDALEKANIEGFDYFEFAQMLQALKPSLPSEQTLFQTAYTSGKVMGATKEKLVQTARVYIDVLNKKAKEFEAACQAKVDELITGREKNLQGMDAAIQEKAAAIQKLTEEINAMSTEKTKMTNEIGENRIKIETKRNNFSATLQTFVGKIQGDIDKIGKYIQ